MAVVALIWVATVEPARLRDDGDRPHLILLGLAAISGALAVTAAVFIGTPTVFLTGSVILAATVVGLVRAIRSVMVDA